MTAQHQAIIREIYKQGFVRVPLAQPRRLTCTSSFIGELRTRASPSTWGMTL
jgi:hypothetical protein